MTIELSSKFNRIDDIGILRGFDIEELNSAMKTDRYYIDPVTSDPVFQNCFNGVSYLLY